MDRRSVDCVLDFAPEGKIAGVSFYHPSTFNRPAAMEVLAGPSDDEGDGSGVEQNHVACPGAAPPAKKPKVMELDGKEQDVALLEMKNGLKRKFGMNMVAPSFKVIPSQFATRIVSKPKQ